MKKLLILGSNLGSDEMVLYAKEKGTYTIVADYLPDEESSAKQLADESVLISTADVDQLTEYSKNEKIDAVLASVSEFNLQKAKKVCDNLGLSFYHTDEQWQKFMNKQNFRDLCLKYGVQTPETFFSGTRKELSEKIIKNIIYPVIIKPVDNGANVGICVCENEEKLMPACDFAFESSECGKIIIEQFIEGEEISCTYVVNEGDCRLVCMGSKYAYENESKLKALSHAYIYPSPRLEEYLEAFDAGVKDMIIKEGINNCSIFFQGIYKEHEFYIFEAGLRFEGTLTFRILEEVNHQNFMHLIVDKALGIPSDYDITKDDVRFGGKKCVVFSMISKGGILSKVSGLEKIKELSGVIAVEQRHPIGHFIKPDDTLRQFVFRFVIINNTIDKIIETVKKINEYAKAYDEFGNDMIIRDFDINILAE